MMIINNEDEVVKVDFKNKSSIELKERRHTDCSHLKLRVDSVLRIVECSLCGATLDPVQVLIEFAHKERQMVYSRQKMEDLRDRVNELSAEERRIKSRIRNAKRKR